MHDTPFLLPYGQAVATFSRGFQLNEAGALIVESLSQVEPFVWYAKKSGLTPDEMEEAREEYDVFLRQLAACGCLQANVRAFQFPEAEPLYGTLKIGPLTVRLQGNADFFSKEFTPFLVEDGTKYSKADMAVPPESNGKAVSSDNSVECISPKNQANVSTSVMREFCPDQTITVTESYHPDYTGSILLLQTYDLELFADANNYYLRFPAMPDVRLAVLSKDGSAACYFVTRPFEKERLHTLQEDLFHAIRHSFLVMAQQKGFFALHSATILYRGRVFAFSGPSGTGKSTHANLWKKEFHVPLVNGDLSLLSLADDGTVLFHGMPWCGTSGITTNVSAPFGGIVFLKQAPENRVEALLPEQEALRLLNRLISPVWTTEMLKANAAFAEEAAERLGIWRLSCNMEPEAAHVMKAAIDLYLDERH